MIGSALPRRLRTWATAPSGWGAAWNAWWTWTCRGGCWSASRGSRWPRPWRTSGAIRHRRGFNESDMAGAGSDRLIDTLVYHGDAKPVAGQMHVHLTPAPIMSLSSRWRHRPEIRCPGCASWPSRLGSGSSKRHGSPPPRRVGPGDSLRTVTDPGCCGRARRRLPCQIEVVDEPTTWP